MRRLLGSVLLAVLCALAPSTSSTAEEASDQAVVDVIALRVVFLSASGEAVESVLTTPDGQAVVLEDLTRELTVRLIPSLQPAAPGTRAAERQVAIQAQRLIRISDKVEQFTIEDVARVTHGSAASLFQGAWLMDVEFADLSTLPESALFQPSGPNNLRPRECCIACGGILYCGLCVQTACGQCCP